MKKVIAAAIGAFAWAGMSASAGAAPAWCKDAAFNDRYDLGDLSSKDPERVLVTFAKATCAPTPEAKASAADIEKARQAWSKKLNMIDADWADVVAYANAGNGGRLELSTKDFAAFTPLDQYFLITEGYAIDGNHFDDVLYIADALDTHLTEVGRIGVIEQCMRDRSPTEVRWAICQGDIDAYDPVKLAAQLRTDQGHPGEVRMAMRFRALELPARLKAHAAEVQKVFKTDEAYKKLWEVAKKARAAWATGLGKDAQLLALAQKLDSATFSRSRKGYEGCEAPTTAALTAAISKLPAKTFAKMQDVRMDPHGGFAKGAGPVLLGVPAINMAAIPYVLCHRKTGTADFLAYYLQETPGFRGPRTAALTAITEEKIVLDDMNAEIRYPSFSDRPYRRTGGLMSSAGGVVKKVTPAGDVLNVEMDKLLVKREQCLQSHETKKISRIRPDGNVEYQRVCDKFGIVTHDEKWADFKIAKRFAPVLKKGVKFSSVHAYNGPADVIAIWPSKTAALPSQVLGAPVK